MKYFQSLLWDLKVGNVRKENKTLMKLRASHREYYLYHDRCMAQSDIHECPNVPKEGNCSPGELTVISIKSCHVRGFIDSFCMHWTRLEFFSLIIVFLRQKVNNPSKWLIAKASNTPCPQTADTHTHMYTSSSGYREDRVIPSYWQTAAVDDISLWFPVTLLWPQRCLPIATRASLLAPNLTLQTKCGGLALLSITSLFLFLHISVLMALHF